MNFVEIVSIMHKTIQICEKMHTTLNYNVRNIHSKNFEITLPPRMDRCERRHLTEMMWDKVWLNCSVTK